MTLTGTSSPEPSVTKDEGPGTPGPESTDSTSANTRRQAKSQYQTSVLPKKERQRKLVEAVN